MTPKEALEISRNVVEEVRRAVEPIAGRRSAAEDVGIGKDGTPTKLIDKVAEDAALRVLREYEVTVVSEEAGVTGEGDTVVALDPIDGTFNATRGIPVYSVALCFSSSRKLRDVFFGYVTNLATGDEWYADSVAYKNGERATVSQRDDINCNAIMYYPTKEYGFRRVRIFGSAALEICFVADGSIDCFIDIRNNGGRGMLRVYDVAASIYIASKAGAVVSDDAGREVWDKRISMDERFKLVVANQKLHKRLLEILK